MNLKEKIAYGLIVFVIASSAFFYLSPIDFLTVNGHSMEPTISDGDAAVILPANGDDVRIGDIIAFRPEEDQQIIHRVVAFENGKIRTKGDNLLKPDHYRIEPSQVVGKHFLTIPKAGIVLEHANSATGFVLLILIPAALIIYNEGRRIRESIWKER